MTLIRDKAELTPRSIGTRYEDDGYTWAIEQAALLREGRLDLIDVANIADEIIDVAKRETQSTRSALRLVLQHLLKWDYQPARRSRSWALTIRTQRRDFDREIRENPGLKPELDRLLAEAYADARDDALAESDLLDSDIPALCPYDWDAITSREIVWQDGR